MRGSKAAAEVAVWEGLISSPDTQTCARILQASMDHGFVSVLTKANEIDYRSSPSSSLLLQPLADFKSLNPVISQFSKKRAASDLHNTSLQVTSSPVRVTSCDHSKFLGSREQPPAERIDVNLAPYSASAPRETTEKGILFHAGGVEGNQGSVSRKMEDFVSPLGGSDSSNLSPTQENDPSVYTKLQELLAHKNASQDSSQSGICISEEPIINAESVVAVQDTGKSYAADDSGHLTLDYQPQPQIPFYDSSDDAEIGEVSNGRFRSPTFSGGLFNPHTPAQARLVIDRIGTVMGLTQMFAETQPSPGSRDRHMILPSSSRPSPDIFNQYQSPKQITSSPLARRGSNMQSKDAVAFNTSSPLESSQLGRDRNQKPANRQPLSERPISLANARDDSSIIGSLISRNSPEPSDIYISRKESQERRRQQARALDDDSQTSDDGFSDDDAQINRRAKRKRKEAAKELAVISTSRPCSAGKDIVEIPSTGTGRRTGLAENHADQCTSLDPRGTQQDATIVDSQSAPAEVTAPSGKNSHVTTGDEPSQLSPRHQHDIERHLALHEKATGDDFLAKLPALEQNEDSEPTGSDREASNFPLRRPLTQSLNGVTRNIAELYTPAMQKKLPYIDGDAIVPETSPSEPHLKRYGGIVSQSPPVPSTEGIDDEFNPFSQDLEFDSLIHSPPRRKVLLSTVLPPKQILDANTETSPKDVMESSNPPTTGLNRKTGAASLARTTATSKNSSESATAPNRPASESFNQISTYSNCDAAALTGVLNGTGLDEVNAQGLRVNQRDSRLLRIEVGVSDVERCCVSVDIAGDSQRALTALPKESANGAANVLGVDHTGIVATKKVQVSSRPLKRSAKRGMVESITTEDIVPVTSVSGPSEVLPNRLRSAIQLKGSSRVLRRLLDDNSEAPSTPTSKYVAPTSSIQKVTRSMRSSTNSSEKAQSIEPEGAITPSLSTRRRTLSNQPSEPGLFNGMAFSVTYNANREDEKQQVLGLIRKNGGRVLEKGFDELFEMASLQGTSRNSEVGGPSSGNNLTLTAAARGIGFACVIADEHSRRVKFMQALALGLPCISGRWIEHCVVKKEIIDWDQYHLAAGESSFLGGAIRSRNLQPYPANSANFADRFELRPKLLTGKSILLITGKGRVEERRKPYFFLTQALGARRVKHVQNNQEARKFLLEAESDKEEWNWVYVDDNEDEAEKAIFSPAPARKRKRGSEVFDESDNPIPPPKKVRIVSDEYVIQSLILGKFLEE